MSDQTSLYYLNIKIDNLSKYNINITESVKQNLIAQGQYINIFNINSDKDINPAPRLIIGYNDYPLYNIKEGRNLVDNYLKKNKNLKNNKDIKIPIQEIFTYDNSNNFNNFYNTVSADYEKYRSFSSSDSLSNLKNETIKNIKKFVSADPNDTDDINNYILFYNIDFLLKNYIFNTKKTNYIELIKNNIKTRFNVTNFEYIIPTGKNNPNFIIDGNKINLKIKLILSEKNYLNILSIKFKLRGDLSTSNDNNNLEHNKKKDEIINDEDNQDTSLNKITNLKKNFDTATSDKYIEFSPSDISNNYKKYDDIILNLNYKLNNNILNNYIQQNNIDDKLKVFFDISADTNFNNYLQIEYKKQQENSNFMKTLTLEKLNINNSIISSEPKTTYITYDSIINKLNKYDLSVNNEDISRNKFYITNYTNGISDNIKFVLDNIIKEQIFFDNKNYHIIKKQYDFDNSNNIVYDFYRSNIQKDNTIYNIYQIIVTLTLLNADKKNNAYNRKKLYCALHGEQVYNSFIASDLSGITPLLNYFKNKKQKTGGKGKYKKKKTLKKKSIKKIIKRKSYKNKKIQKNKKLQKNKK